MSSTDQAGAPEEPISSAVPFTCRITAAFRAVELARGAPPIIHDPLACHLAGDKALGIAAQDYDKLVAAQGPGLHMRVPARNRLLDDQLLHALEQLQAAGVHGPVQVVNVGAGMDTRPWRLAFPSQVSYFDVDQPDVMSLKLSLLAKAGALLSSVQPSTGSTPGPTTGSCSAGGGATGTGSAGGSVHTFPLMAASWHGVGADLSKVSLRDALMSSGAFVEGAATVWVAEALLYYLTLPQAADLLCAMAALSGPGSMLLATCIDRELLDASLYSMEGHYFSKLWHFCMDHLYSPSSSSSEAGTSCHAAGAARLQDSKNSSGDGAAVLPAKTGHVLADCGWNVVDPPCTTAELALARYGMRTYVPDYGGAECLFSARLCRSASVNCA